MSAVFKRPGLDRLSTNAYVGRRKTTHTGCVPEMLSQYWDLQSLCSRSEVPLGSGIKDGE